MDESICWEYLWEETSFLDSMRKFSTRVSHLCTTFSWQAKEVKTAAATVEDSERLKEKPRPPMSGQILSNLNSGLVPILRA